MMEQEDLIRAADLSLALDREVEQRVLHIVAKALGATDQELQDTTVGWLIARGVWHNMRHNVEFRSEVASIARAEAREVAAKHVRISSTTAPFVYNTATPVSSAD